MAKLSEDARDIFADAYRFYESHWDDPDNVDSWVKRAEEIGKIVQKHGGNRLAVNLLMACYQTMDEDTKAIRQAIGV